MLTTENIKKLKQTNVSADTQLTKERVKASLGAASREQKHRIDALAGLKRTSINRVYTTGNISAKIALALGQILDADPAWYTGEAEMPGAFSAKAANTFLNAKGYEAMAEEPAPPPKRKYTRKPKPEPIEEEAIEAEPEILEPEEEAPAPMPEPLDISEEDATRLLSSMFIRAGYSGEANRKLQEVLNILVR